MVCFGLISPSHVRTFYLQRDKRFRRNCFSQEGSIWPCGDRNDCHVNLSAELFISMRSHAQIITYYFILLIDRCHFARHVQSDWIRCNRCGTGSNEIAHKIFSMKNVRAHTKCVRVSDYAVAVAPFGSNFDCFRLVFARNSQKFWARSVPVTSWRMCFFLLTLNFRDSWISLAPQVCKRLPPMCWMFAITDLRTINGLTWEIVFFFSTQPWQSASPVRYQTLFLSTV